MEHSIDKAVTLALLLAAAGCSDPAPSVLDEIIERGHYQFAGPAIAAPVNTQCLTLDPAYDPDALRTENTFCSFTYGGRTYRDGERIVDEASYYIHRIGEPDPTNPLAEEPWAREEARYCLITSELTAEPVPGFPESDVQRVAIVTVDATHPCEILIGGTTVVYLARGSREGSIIEMYDAPEGGINLYRGTWGVAATGSDPNTSVYQSCTPTLGLEGEGYCEPTCRLYSAGDNLPECDWTHLPILPANRDLIDPAWADSHRELLDEVFPAGS